MTEREEERKRCDRLRAKGEEITVISN